MQKLKQSTYTRFRLRPAVIRTVNGQRADDDWISRGLNEYQQLEVENVRTGHVLKLASDQIHHFDSDPNRQHAGLTFGFLELNVQTYLTDREVMTERLAHFPHQRHRK